MKNERNFFTKFIYPIILTFKNECPLEYTNLIDEIDSDFNAIRLHYNQNHYSIWFDSQFKLTIVLSSIYIQLKRIHKNDQFYHLRFKLDKNYLAEIEYFKYLLDLLVKTKILLKYYYSLYEYLIKDNKLSMILNSCNELNAESLEINTCLEIKNESETS